MKELSKYSKVIFILASGLCILAPLSTLAKEAPSIKYASQKIGDVEFAGIEFDSRYFRLKVVDQRKGPGSKYADAEAAAQAVTGVAAINAGFFNPDGSPLGLVVSSHQSVGEWNGTSSLGSGVWYANAKGDMRMCRRAQFTRSKARSLEDLLQAGPVLVYNGKALVGLEAKKSAIRSIVLYDGGTRWWIGVATHATLAQTAKKLESFRLGGSKVAMALNLDGGSSTDFWATPKITSKLNGFNSLFRKHVRNYLVLIKR